MYFYLNISMRRDFVIFYFENNKIGNACRRCLFNKNEMFLLKISMKAGKAGTKLPLRTVDNIPGFFDRPERGPALYFLLSRS